MFSRRIGAVACALGMSVVLAGCGSSAKSYTPLTQATFAKAISDAAGKASSVHVVETSPNSTIEQRADYSFQGAGAAQVTLTATVGANTNTIVWRVVGSSVWALLPSGPQAGKWAKVPESAATSSGSLNPKSLAAIYEKDAKSISYVGITSINGETAYQYEVVLPLSALVASGTSLATLPSSIARLKTVTEQIYLSDANLLQRILIEYPAPVGSMQADYTQWNQVAPITAPPADQIAKSGK